ncbi:acetyltransferase, GNAT family [Bacteriovorax sp. BSW11_IV]|uniref:GNAT family N-acetyltransferase n=1 Tax=Bacteriovorax sp. BSW11_IV TaxID=1353529 RepID=UPI00038A1E8C|nr:GNAT family N-acetyltransferase [Bacteriovorax sp. BSW11_IV]EQC49168.1 acetyltransferase, GNAT family [Bacteriovorax sp. BSW11_IV]
MMNTIIRKAKPGEEAQIHEAHMRSIREICVIDHGEEEIRGWGYRPLGDRWVRAIQEEDVWVIDSNSSILGLGHIVFLRNENEEYGYINALYLTPEIIGQGFAKILLLEMINFAKNRGVHTIELGSTITAYNFYKKMGFVDNGGERFVNIGGYPVRSYPMILHLI